jgi:hypothetical protein
MFMQRKSLLILNICRNYKLIFKGVFHTTQRIDKTKLNSNKITIENQSFTSNKMTK